MRDCVHCMSITFDELEGTVAFCKLYDQWKSIDFGECFGCCAMQKSSDKGEDNSDVDRYS